MYWLGLFLLGLLLKNGQSYILPDTVVPSKYVVDIFVPQGAFTGQNDTFEGEVTMTFTVTGSTNEINLNHRSTIKTVTVSNEYGEANTVTNTSYNSTTEIFTVTVQNTLTINKTYSLKIMYNATLEQDNMRGLYISTYIDESNQTSYLVLTKFEPVHSRHAFPCLDQPKFKSTFVLSLTYPLGLNALANTNISSNVPVDSTYQKTTFQETTIMSTYLLAFAISEFTCTEGYSVESGVAHRVCSRPEAEPDRAWAVEIGTTLLRSLESMFGNRYGVSMPKMDQIAIPDFSSGAMENWGLVSYREAYLLWSESESSNNYKKTVALIIAHEFAHMWFGNLVTCQWWDYIFLNEGFARYYQYLAGPATKTLSDWELEKHFNVEVVQVALLADSTDAAWALTAKSYSASQISTKFSTIAYSKGAAILRMIEKNIMGADNFLYGLRQYLTDYAYQATIPANLWASLADHVPSNVLPSDVSLQDILYNWVEKSGHPAVLVTKSGNDVILTQERFLLTTADNATREYYVPVTYTSSNDTTTFKNTTAKTWLIPDQSLTLSDVLTDSDWIILNNRQSGFYRVDYDSTLWEAIKTQLHENHLVVDVLNRAQLVSDVYNFARSGTNTNYRNWTYAEALDIISYLQYEDNYFPWYAAIVGNNHLLQRIGYESTVGQQFISWMLTLMQKVYSTVPFDLIDNSDQVYSMKQALVLSRVCKYGEKTCVSKAKDLFAQWRDEGVAVPKNLRVTVYCNALRYSGNATTDFNFLWQKYTETNLMTEVVTMYAGLSCSQDTESLKWLLGQTINSTSGIRLQDFTTVWSYVYSSSAIGTNAALEYIADNYETLTAAYAYSSVASLISGAAGYIYDEDQLEKLQAISNTTGLTSNHLTTVENAVSTAQTNIEWAETVREVVKAHIEAQSGAPMHTCSLALALGVCLLSKVLFY